MGSDSVFGDEYARFVEVRAALVRVHGDVKGRELRTRAELESAAATGYVWGRQDGAGQESDSQAAEDFGSVYGFVVALWHLELITNYPPLEVAYAQWVDGKGILATYKGESEQRVDRLELGKLALSN